MGRFDERAADFTLENAFFMAQVAALSYSDDRGEIQEEANAWGFPLVEFISVLDTEAILLASTHAIILSFRGTEPDTLQDWATDLRIRMTGAPLAGRAHRGFIGALLNVWEDRGPRVGVENLLSLRRSLVEEGNGKPPVWITGHSMGGALAVLAAAMLAESDMPIWGVYTFGCPRVGDEDFARAYEAKLGRRTYRVVNNNDVVTRVPPRVFGYRHVGRFFYLSERCRVTEDPSAWMLFLDRSLGRILDIGEVGTDGIKDHAIDGEEDGYISGLRKALSDD